MDFRGQVLQTDMENELFGCEIESGFGRPAAHPD